MLYDNPQLVSTYLAAFQITGDPLYASEHLIVWPDVAAASTVQFGGHASPSGSGGSAGQWQQGLTTHAKRTLPNT